MLLKGTASIATMSSINLNVYLEKVISLQTIEILHIEVPQKEVFQSAIAMRKAREAMVVRIMDTDGHVGYGESSARPDPYYSSEFVDASMTLIEKFILPHLEPQIQVGEFLQWLKKIRGWPFTVAGFENAIHDLLAKRHGKYILDYWKAPRLEKVPVGISIGLQKSPDALESVIMQSLKEGYRRLKFKVFPGMNENLLPVFEKHKNDFYISFDANGSFHKEHIDQLAFYTQFDTAFEQPFPADRFDVLLEAKKALPDLKICFDEEVKSLGDLIKLHQLGVVDELNLKPGRVGGLLNALEILDYCQAHNIPCWIGGMFETGIGRSQNIQLASLIPDAVAHDLSPSSRYFIKDVLKNPIKMDENGFTSLQLAQQAEVDKATIEEFVRYKIVKNIVL